MNLKLHALAASLAFVAAATQASTVTLTQGSGFQSGLPSAAAYQSAVNTAVAGSTPVVIPSFDGVYASNDKALKYTIGFGLSAAQAGNYTFEFGVDFGGGGAVFLDGVAVAYNPNDIWWGGFDKTNVSFQFSQGLSAGVHTIDLYGFEHCCSGANFGQFHVDGGQTVTFGANDGLAPVSEPESLAMMMAGLGALALAARRRKI